MQRLRQVGTPVVSAVHGQHDDFREAVPVAVHRVQVLLHLRHLRQRRPAALLRRLRPRLPHVLLVARAHRPSGGFVELQVVRPRVPHETARRTTPRDAGPRSDERRSSAPSSGSSWAADGADAFRRSSFGDNAATEPTAGHGTPGDASRTSASADGRANDAPPPSPRGTSSAAASPTSPSAAPGSVPRNAAGASSPANDTRGTGANEPSPAAAPAVERRGEEDNVVLIRCT